MGNNEIVIVTGTDENRPTIPLGALYVSDALRKNGFSPTIISDNISHCKFEEVIKTIDPLMVGFSVITGKAIPRMICLSKIAKNNQKVTVWGGPLSFSVPKIISAEEYIDYNVIGEGEVAAVMLAESLYKNIRPSQKEVGPFPVTDINKFHPSWDLMDLNEYAYEPPGQLRDYQDRLIFRYLNTSRGCLFGCGFCGVNNLFGGKPNRKMHSLEWVIQQIEAISKRVKVDGLTIWDDSFLETEKLTDREVGILEYLSDKNLKYMVESRAKALHSKETVRFLKESGCIQIYVGAESGSERVLHLMRKGNHPLDYLIAANNCSSVGIQVRFSFMYGYPGETIEDIIQTKNLISQLESISGVTISGPKLYRPVPGTNSYLEAVKMGITPFSKIADFEYITSEAGTDSLPWLKKELDEEGITSNEAKEWLKLRKEY